ncbi:L-dopachrome tautomerase-related protein [Sediminicola arcticus]|jgi:sugar lactone lactonase YvrE|uniref:L-dopachrome tautomerase-related protein n=1 Tax=Sediminicola arcticus TaxID=1574308 RepID=A0ABV2SXP1_9FLAO
MKKIVALLSAIVLCSCGEKTKKEQPKVDSNLQSEAVQSIEEVAIFKGQQVTGVTVSDKGRIFANFPRWRKGVPFSVVEVNGKDGSYTPYPNKEMNMWEIGEEVTPNAFVGVQSVVAFENILYVLDTRSALFEPILDEPRVFVFNLETDALVNIYIIPKGVAKPNSYINDLRVDKKNGKIYFTDSGAGGLLVLDIVSGKSKRVLGDHPSTMAEMDHLTFDNGQWNNTINSDGIALDTKNNKLYYHALTGYSLYAIDTEVLASDKNPIHTEVQFIKKTGAPDGMIFDDKGNLYLADLEHNKINYLTPSGDLKTLLEGDVVKWADTFSIYNGFLYYTNSRINEVKGEISEIEFTINKIAL